MVDDNPGSAATIAGSSDTIAPTGQRDLGPPPSLLAERYQVLALLGVGGMGRVYRVHDRALDEVVALKLLRRELVGDTDMVERFRREVKLARKVTNPHVVRTFDLGQHGDEYFLTMEYVEGRSLASLLELGPLALDEVLRIARAACTGMAAAHAAGVWHRDLKPDNVLVATGGRIAITDFGIARAQKPGAAVETIERFVGTPAYMAPEQVDGSAPVGPATDVYAFGAIVFEMLAGRRAFTGDDPIRVAVARLTTAPPDPRMHRVVPDALANLVLRCLARDPAKRYADGATLGAALAALGTDTAGATLPQPMLPIVPAKSSRAVAVLPLRSSTPELAELADGLGEEIVDALTLTRALRVRPLASVRAAAAANADPRAVGLALGVDVVVDGSLRKIGEIVRISARAIGVADGFQLSADRVDARPDELLAAGDAIAQAVARALTVELAVPARAAIDPRATEMYLEGKSKCRSSWMLGPMRPAVELLERALALAPNDPTIMAALAVASSREAFFFGTVTELARARTLAEQVVVLAPSDGDGWLALGLVNLYANDIAASGSALFRSVSAAPGQAMAQAALGAVLLEAGALSDGIAHLEAALALDPSASLARWDLARGLVYDGRFDAGIALLDEFTGERSYAEITRGRFLMWRGERFTAAPLANPAAARPDLFAFAEAAFEFYRTHTFTPEIRAQLVATIDVPNGRLRATRAQFYVEFLVAGGDLEGAFDYLDVSVTNGLHDTLWLARCPILDPLRGDPRFARLAAIVADRATAVLAAVQSSR